MEEQNEKDESYFRQLRYEKSQAKAILVSLIVFLLTFLIFMQSYLLANDLNNEISFRNYLKNPEMNNHYIPDSPENDDIKKFPLTLKALLIITMVLIMISVTYYWQSIMRFRDIRKFNESFNDQMTFKNIVSKIREKI